MSIPSYNLGYPQNGSTLGQSKATIRNNLDGTFLTLRVNHFDNNSMYPGQHQFIQMPNSSVAPPVPNLGTEIDLYNGGSTLGGENNLFLLPPGSTDLEQAIQMTRASNFPTSNSTSGFSWLPGGFVIQWGLSSVPAGGTQPVSFPLTVTTTYSVLVTGLRSNTGGDGIFVLSGSVSGAGFTLRNGSGSITQAYWMAIGA
jgi:hypothetical protein